MSDFEPWLRAREPHLTRLAHLLAVDPRDSDPHPSADDDGGVEVLGISRGTVKSQASRVLERLRRDVTKVRT